MWREWKARETEELFQTEETGETWELDPMHGPGLDPLSRTLSEQLTKLEWGLWAKRIQFCFVF